MTEAAGTVRTQSRQDKREGRRAITISTLASIVAICVVILPIVGTITWPWFKGFMSEAVAGEIDSKVQRAVSEQVQPINAGLKVMIASAIAQLELDISAAEWRRDNSRDSWTALDARILADARQRLRNQQEALNAIVAAELRASDDKRRGR